MTTTDVTAGSTVLIMSARNKLIGSVVGRSDIVRQTGAREHRI